MLKQTRKKLKDQIILFKPSKVIIKPFKPLLGRNNLLMKLNNKRMLITKETKEKAWLSTLGMSQVNFSYDADEFDIYS